MMIDYILISLAVVVCPVMWWSFLAVSGLKKSRPGERKALCIAPKKDTINPLMN
jgi:hypothetical protein